MEKAMTQMIKVHFTGKSEVLKMTAALVSLGQDKFMLPIYTLTYVGLVNLIGH